MRYTYRQLGEDDVGALLALLRVFGEAFDEVATYQDAVPSEAYLRQLLARPQILVVVATLDGEVAGGLVAYELEKLEQERREVYIYDLAVAAGHRRRGVATALIEELRRLARKRGAYVIFVQADHGDDPAIRLYESLGSREEVLHFDIPVDPPSRPL